MTARVLFYVQHLLGIGHLKRAATLAHAIAEAGLEVTVVSGGMELAILDTDGFDLVQLPALRARDRSFSGLVDARGQAAGETMKARRRELLLGTFRRVQPSVVVVELYPFGRRQMRFEIEPLLEAAWNFRPRPRIVCSVRDILVEKNRPDREAEMAAAARAWFDHILVHGDPDFISFAETFGPAGEIADMLHYTGYVVEPAAEPLEKDGKGEVIVSAGSGATGEILLRTAMGTRAGSSLRGALWRILAGPNLSDRVFAELKSEAGEGVVVERARADFPGLLAGCRLSISQGGYNTLMEVLAAGARAVAVPYGGGSETEQTLRCRLLAQRGLLSTLDEAELTEASLSKAMEEALAALPPAAPAIRMDGARTTARLVAGWI